MEIKIEEIKREEGPTWNQQMRYFKIPLCRIFSLKRHRLIRVKRRVSVVS